MKTTHKCGTKIPKSTKHAYRIDEKNGSRFWRYTNKKDIHNESAVFEILE